MTTLSLFRNQSRKIFMLNFKKIITDRQALQQQALTSDAYKDRVKIFLNELRIHKDIVKNSTYRIIYKILTDFTLPKKDEQMRIRTQQQINLITLILKMIEVHHEIDILTIATYTLNKEAFSILQDLIYDRRIHRCVLFLASSYGYRSPEEYERFKATIQNFQSQGFDVYLVFAWLHFKITMAQCDENFYHIEGSMNYSTNNMAEQLICENSREIYEFDEALFRDIIITRERTDLEIIGNHPYENISDS